MDIVKNNLTNLIPIVNPALKIENGIKLAIMYRILPTTEIDSSELVREAYKNYMVKIFRNRQIQYLMLSFLFWTFVDQN